MQGVQRSILDDPYITNLCTTASAAQAAIVFSIFAHLQTVSPVLASYRTMLERQHASNGLVLMPERCVARFLQPQRDRSPVARFQEQVQATAVYLSTNAAPIIPQQLPEADTRIGEPMPVTHCDYFQYHGTDSLYHTGIGTVISKNAELRSLSTNLDSFHSSLPDLHWTMHCH